jgi:hypothetical protein
LVDDVLGTHVVTGLDKRTVRRERSDACWA